MKILIVEDEPKAGDPLRQGLAAALNRMLDRLEAAFRRLGEYSADIANELRTPIRT